MFHVINDHVFVTYVATFLGDLIVLAIKPSESLLGENAGVFS